MRRAGMDEPVALLADDNACGDRAHRSGLPILRGRHHLERLRADGVEGVVIAIGDEHTRMKLSTVAIQAGFSLCTVLHPSAVICPDVQIGGGTVVFAGAVVQTGSAIGSNVVVNTCASIDHD